MGEKILRIKRDGLIHDTVSGEAIVLNLDSGTYYSMTETAAEIWGLLGSDLSLAQLTELLEHHYAKIPTLREDLGGFIDKLLEEGLVYEDGDAGSAIPGTFSRAEDWRKPELVAFDDLQDLLTIDPIHDVDDSGWPNAKRS